jgi:hypothetical protein
MCFATTSRLKSTRAARTGTSERIVLVFGIVDTRHAGGVHGMGDEHEDILTVVLPAQVFIDANINDLKTLVAGYWFAQFRSGGRR